MQKHKCLTSIVGMIMCLTFFQHIAMAQNSLQVSVSSQGTIRYPMPISTPIGSNLVNVPDNFTNEINFWDYIALDTTVYRSYPSSLRLDPDTSGRGTRECNTHWFNVEGGDRIVWKIWCKTSYCESNDIAAGGRIGIDLYGGALNETWDKPRYRVDSLPHDYVYIDGEWYSGKARNKIATEETMPLIPKSQFTVVWGTEEWTLIYLDFIVPDIIYYRNSTGQYLPEPYKVVGCIPWIDARSVDDYGIAWFDDSEFYINPQF